MALHPHSMDEQQDRISKSRVLVVVISVFFVLLIVRLVYIQIIDAELNIRLSKENSMRLNVLKAPRGRILDRDGRVLARNRPSYSICVLPYKLKNRQLIIQCLLKIRYADNMAVFDSVELVERLKKANYRRFDATSLIEDVSLDLVSIIQEHAMELPGIIIETESRREYPLGPGAFHLLGYMGEIPEDIFDSMKTLGYAYGDLIGKSGIEKQYEKLFKGKNGVEYIEVNAHGKSLGLISNMPRIDPIPGADVYLAVDARLQRVAQKAFPDSLKGAVVALDPRTGEVLVMFSSPAPDPNMFSSSSSVRNKNWQNIITDPNLPLNNRAISGTYSPGSTFKLISAISGVATGKILGTDHMPRSCGGTYRIGSRVAHCWKLSGHGSLNLIDAVKNSCNVFFYQVGLKLGDRCINTYADMFGLGTKTGIDIPEEQAGWLSGEDAYNKRFVNRNWKWTAGLVLDLAIGQAQLTTPIQLASMCGAMANGHALFKPHLLSKVLSADTNLIMLHKSEMIRNLQLNEYTISTMRQAMRGVLEAGGTGGRASVPGIVVGGKTGSSQNPQGELTHALFIGTAPVDSPIIAISVVVENAGHGGSIAAPIAGEVLRYFFQHNTEGRRLLTQAGVKLDTIKAEDE